LEPESKQGSSTSIDPPEYPAGFSCDLRAQTEAFRRSLPLFPALKHFANRIEGSLFVWLYLIEPMAGRIFGDTASKKRSGPPLITIHLCKNNDPAMREVRRTCNVAIHRKL
jgi:hypothetical protein